MFSAISLDLNRFSVKFSKMFFSRFEDLTEVWKSKRAMSGIENKFQLKNDSLSGIAKQDDKFLASSSKEY